MREIEVKARLNDKDGVVSKLEALSCMFGEPLVQHDRIYLAKGCGLQGGHTGNVLRIRKQGGKVLFTLKRNITNELDCIEKEVEVSSAAEMEDILKLLDFEEVVQVRKSRRKCKYQNCEICVDEVEGLGSFIEVEALVEEDGGETGMQDQLFSFLESLGVSKSDRVVNGYDTLIYQKNKISK